MTDSVAATDMTAANVSMLPKSAAYSRGPRVLFASAAVLIIVVGGIAGNFFRAQPVDRPARSKAPSVAAIQVSLPAVNFEASTDSKDDIQLDHLRRRFTQLMIDAGIAFNLRKYDEAVAAYADASRLFPEDSDVQRKLGDARVAAEAQEKSRRELEQVKNEASALLKRGQEALEKDQVAAAIELFKLALEKSPTSEEAAQKLLSAQNRLQKIDAEKKALDDFDRHILAGKAALQAGRAAEALREYRAASRILPNDPLLPELIKVAERQLGQVKDQDDRKKQYQALLDQAAALVRLKKLEDADDALRQALKLYPDDAVALRSLQDVQKSLKKAKADVANLLAQAQNAIAASNLAAAMAFLQNAETILPADPELLRALRAIQLIQLNQVAYFQAINRAIAAMSLRRFGDALLAYSDALRIVPNDPLATIGFLEAQRGLQILNRKQLEYDVLVNQGLLLLRSQRYADAARSFEGAIRLVRPPLFPDPQVLSLARYAEAMAQGLAALSARQFPAAAQFFQRALLEVPNDTAAQLGMQKARLGLRA
jgi:tetratricopeptide (TPR) repeat protein